MNDDKVKIHPPLYMIGRDIECWRCESVMPVIALLAPKTDDAEGHVAMLTEIEDIPLGILKFIQSNVPTFKLKYSKMARKKYFANTCPKCGVISGDFFLQSKSDGPFFPMDEEASKLLYIREIPLTEPIEVSAGGLGSGHHESILSNAKRI